MITGRELFEINSRIATYYSYELCVVIWNRSLLLGTTALSNPCSHAGTSAASSTWLSNPTVAPKWIYPCPPSLGDRVSPDPWRTDSVNDHWSRSASRRLVSCHRTIASEMVAIISINQAKIHILFNYLGRKAMSCGQAVWHNIHDCRSVSIPNQSQTLTLSVASNGISPTKRNASKQDLNL